MVFNIEVTQDDIDEGERQSTCDCPIALALSRATGLEGGYGEMDIDADGLYVNGKRTLRRASNRLPSIARDFIREFDAGREVSPIRFQLTVFNWCLSS
jgi:hypothetical protein